MKIIITETQSKLLNEISRDWRDEEHEEIFDKTKTNVIKSLKRKLKSYYEDDRTLRNYITIVHYLTFM